MNEADRMPRRVIPLIWMAASGLSLACGTGSPAGSRSQTDPGSNTGAGGGGAGGPHQGEGGLGVIAVDGGLDEATSGSYADKCHVPADTNGNAPICTKHSPPNAFSPKLKWSWSVQPQGMFVGSMATPLVGNLTDDNGDGEVNLCDVPDVLVTLLPLPFATDPREAPTAKNLVMLAGDTGKLEIEFAAPVDGNVTPAFGDIDADGLPEVIADGPDAHLVAFDNHGKVKWKSPDEDYHVKFQSSYCHAISLYDLDGDGKSEIIAAFEVYDHAGHRLFSYDISQWDGQYWCPANTAADLDGDGKLEVIFGNAAYRADGSRYWQIPGPPGQPQVGNLDADPEPEILIARNDGILILEHDGKVKYGPVQAFDPGNDPRCWSKPAVIHDFDGDGKSDIMISSCEHIAIFHAGASSFELQWSAAIDDDSGVASSTAFDFLGRGIADAVYGDQKKLWVFDGKSGNVEFSQARTSGTLIEYPVVADVDNDGSVDVVVISNTDEFAANPTTGQFVPAPLTVPMVQVFEDAEKRWIPGRRIWNQHAYHVTNVREDGTIPAHMAKNWQRLNTFRTNAQFEGTECAPPPANVK
jgi:hypothetical protein